MKLNLRIAFLFSLFALGAGACVSGTGESDDFDSDDSDVDVASDQSAISQDGRYIVKLNDWAAGKAAIAAVGGVARELPNKGAIAAYLPADALNGLQNHPAVDFIEVDPRRELYGQSTPYGIDMVQANDPAFSDASGAVKVCIIDSGFYASHEDLSSLPVTGEAGTAWNVDGCGHGTHVAGTVAAAQNSLGVVGVAPNSVSLHIVRVFGNDCSWSYASDLVAALDECQSAGAKVVSMSLGGSFKSNFENSAFQSAYNAGVLSIAAAGNDGNTRVSYPGGYASVVSVAAVDSNKMVADFSQKNSTVEIAAPGVAVLSTVPWKSTNDLTVGGTTFNGAHIDFAALGSPSGAVVNGGLCDSVGSWNGKVVMCERGSISFYDKVMNVQSGGGAAAVIYNNAPGGFLGTLGDGNSSNIPAISLSQEDGQTIVAGLLGQTGQVESTFVSPGSGYEAWDGTSMATPHVSGVAALVWSMNPSWTNADIRAALQNSAEDLGAAGRDNAYGYGLVQAKAALDLLQGGGSGGGGGGGTGGGPTCGASGDSCSSGADCCSGVCSGKGKNKSCN